MIRSEPDCLELDKPMVSKYIYQKGKLHWWRKKMLKFELSLSAFKVIIPIMCKQLVLSKSKKKLVKEKTIKIEKTRQHNSSAVDFPSTM